MARKRHLSARRRRQLRQERHYLTRYRRKGRPKWMQHRANVAASRLRKAGLARHPHRGDPFVRQARLEAKVRYGPEEAALKELLHEAKQTLKFNVSSERGVAEGIRAALREAKPALTKVYSDAGRSMEQANADVERDLAKLSSAADPQKAASAREIAGARRRLLEATTQAQQELQARSVGAAQGAAYAIRGHQAEFQQDVAKIHRSKLALKGQKGAFILSTSEDLRSAAQKASQEERKFRETVRSHKAGERAAMKRIRQGSRKIKQSERHFRLQQRQKDQDQALARRKERRMARQGGRGKKGGPTGSETRRARAQWRKAITLTRQGRPKRREGNAWVAFLAGKDIPEPIARGATQTYLFGGVRRGTRHYLWRNYRLKPRTMGSARRRSGRRFRRAFKRNFGI